MFLTIPLLIAALLMPKLSALVVQLHPGISSVVICTGTQMVTLLIGPDGQPIEDLAMDHTPCTAPDPVQLELGAFASWFAAPRSYRHSFVAISHVMGSQLRLGLLAEVRGPPRAA